MGDNKISDAAVEAASSMYEIQVLSGANHELAWVAALDAALPHLQGEAVPVLSEVSGNSGELGALRKALALAVQQNSHDMLMTGEEIRLCEAALAATGKQQDAKLCTNCNGSGEGREIVGYGPDDYYEVDAACSVCDGAGKQQVGEVQGDARRILAKHMRRIAAAHNVPRLGTEADIVEGGEECDFWMYAAHAAVSEALAARQPVAIPFDTVQRVVKALTQHGVATPESQEEQSARAIRLIHELCRCAPAQVIDLGQFRQTLARAVTWARRSDVTSHAGDADNIRKLLALIDGRDAGAEVGNVQPPRDLRTKLGEG